MPKAPFSETLQAVKRLRQHGLTPVPHLSARATADKAQLFNEVSALVSEGVEEVLLIAGSQAQPIGQFDNTMQILETGVLEQLGVKRIGLAAHPEGHPQVDEFRLQAAIEKKNEFARASSSEFHLVTQFFFDAGPVIRWERRIRECGNRLPVHVGFHGVSGATSLFRHAVACGIGPSIKVLTQHMNMLQLAVVRSPERLVLDVATATDNDGSSLFSGAHFFPLGGFKRTVAWANAIAEGRFMLDDAGSLRLDEP